MPRMTAVHGSEPEWPIFLCDKPHAAVSTRPHYHVTGPRDDGNSWNYTVWNQNGETTILGRRFSANPADVAPVQECTESHDDNLHLHSRDVASGTILSRSLEWDSDYEPLPGVFAKGDILASHRVNTPTAERENTMSTTFTPGQIVTAPRAHLPSRSDGSAIYLGESGTRDCVVITGVADGPGWNIPSGGETFATPEMLRRLSDLRARAWSIPKDQIAATDLPLPAPLAELRRAVWPESGDPEPVELHPLTPEGLRAHPHFTLHSKPGTRDGNAIVFGCQRFPMSVVADARGSMNFTPGGVVVTMPAQAEGDYVRVGDRQLGRGDVNDWTVSITADSAPTQPDNAIVMEYGFYGCATHRRDHVLYLLDGPDGPRVGKVYVGVDGGIIGQRHGFARTLRGCVPVKGSATARVMGIEQDRKFALVPFAPTGGDFSDFTKGHLPPNGGDLTITPCTVDGSVL